MAAICRTYMSHSSIQFAQTSSVFTFGQFRLIRNSDLSLLDFWMLLLGRFWLMAAITRRPKKTEFPSKLLPVAAVACRGLRQAPAVDPLMTNLRPFWCSHAPLTIPCTYRPFCWCAVGLHCDELEYFSEVFSHCFIRIYARKSSSAKSLWAIFKWHLKIEYNTCLFLAVDSIPLVKHQQRLALFTVNKN